MGEHKRIHKQHRHISIDAYAYRSGLREWNVTYKVFFAVGSLITVIAADSIPLSIMTILFMGWVSCMIGRIRADDYLRVLRIPMVFILMSGITILIQVGSGKESIYSLSFFSTYLFITKESLRQAATVSLKALGAVSSLYLLTLSTPMGEIINVFRRLHVPKVIVELMHFIYRYIFILLEGNNRQKEAAKSRLGYSDRKTSLRTFGSEMANMFVISMVKARNYYDALESRGYEGNCLFYEDQRKLQGKQIIWGTLYAVLTICIIRSNG